MENSIVVYLFTKLSAAVILLCACKIMTIEFFLIGIYCQLGVLTINFLKLKTSPTSAGI